MPARRGGQNAGSVPGALRAMNSPMIRAAGKRAANTVLAARKCAPVVSTSSTIATDAGSGSVKASSIRYQPAICRGAGRTGLSCAAAVLADWMMISRMSAGRPDQIAPEHPCDPVVVERIVARLGRRDGHERHAERVHTQGAAERGGPRVESPAPCTATRACPCGPAAS